MILFVPQILYGLYLLWQGIKWIGMAIWWVTRAFAAMAGPIKAVGTVAIGVGKFLLGWKAVVVGIVGWLLFNLFGYGDKFFEGLVFLAETIGGWIYGFFFNEQFGLAWIVCDALLFLGGVFLDTLGSFGLLESTVEKYADMIALALEYAGKFDKFFPVTEMMMLLGLFFTFVLFFIAGKFIMKLIPTVG